MAFDGTEGAPISPSIAGDWTRNFRDSATAGINAHFFGRDILEELLAADGAVGIRFYHGLDDDDNRQLLAVAVDAEQNDLLESTNIVADESQPCPPFGSNANVLNS